MTEAMDRKRYSSARFIALPDNKSIASARKTYLIWIITVTILFCISAAYFSYKTIISSDSLSNKKPQSSTSNNNVLGTEQSNKFSLTLYNPKKFLDRFIEQNINDGSEFSCEESSAQIKVIPAVAISELLHKGFNDIYSYISLDLLLHYEYIINKYDAKSLKSIFNKYQTNLFFTRKSEDFITFLTVLKSNKFQFYANFLKHEKYNLELKHFENYFTLIEEFNHWYNYLDRLLEFLLSYEQQKVGRYLKNCTEKIFEKYTEETQKRMFHFAYSFNMNIKKLQEINSVINDWTKPLKTEVYNNSVIFYSKVVILSEINKIISDLNVTFLENVFVFASHTIYLDEDMKLFGVNLAVIAPNWVFLKKIKINLNGTSGENYKESASSNQSGKPGNSGGNAGNFLGIGNFPEKFLSVSADGGKGGNGQNGAKGRDGVDNTHPDPPVNRPACMAKINTFNNSFGQIITHYKIYNRAGCGSSGTDGGIGGAGGNGGVITLISRNFVKTTKGLTGSPGTPGKGGAGGFGGRNGCFYEVFDVDNEILHRVTIVKCPPNNILPSGDFGRDNYNTHGRVFPPAKENFRAHSCFLWYIQFVGSDLIKHNDAEVILLLKELKNLDISNQTVFKSYITEYKLLKEFDDINFYELYNEKILKYTKLQNNNNNTNVISPLLECLKTIVLGRIIILRGSVNFFFIDLKIFFNVLKTSIKSTNDFNTQPISYLSRKIEIKLEQIKINIKNIKMKLDVLSPNSENEIRKFYVKNYTECLSKGLEKNFLCVIISIVEIISEVIAEVSETLGFDCTQKQNTENTSLPPKYICLENVSEILAELSLTKINILNKNQIKKNLLKLKNCLFILKESNLFLSEKNNLLEDFIDELEHFIALYYFIEWKELENLFSKSLDNLALSKRLLAKEDEDVKFLKTELVNVWSSIMHKLAVDAVRQNLLPFINLNTHFQLLKENMSTNEILAQMNYLLDISSQETIFFCKNHLKAVFDKRSAVGEFYFWSNAEIHQKLQRLFSGAEINLKSNLINRHVFDKNFIQFRTLKFEFECIYNKNSCVERLREVLFDFKVEIIHSGYSYYNWEGETHIVVSEKVSLDYSFRMRDSKEPEVYNAMFGKCQDGEIKLSPFTTWTIRLLPLNNKADFTKLSPFVSTVNLRLVGIGTYIS